MPRTIIPQEKKDEALEMYKAGIVMTEISVRTGLALKVIRLAAKKAGLPLRSVCGRPEATYHCKTTGRLVTPEYLKELYDAGLSQEKIAERTGRDQATISDLLNRVGTLIRPRSTRGQYRTPKYKRNDTFFSLPISSEKQAYWLGFLTADGYINDQGVGADLSSVDEVHLHKMKADLGCEQQVTRRTRTRDILGRAYSGGCSRLFIYSQRMVSDLKYLGFTKNKSKDARLDGAVPDFLLPHFFRGLIDGDGSIFSSVTRTDLRQWSVSVCGTKAIVRSFEKFVKKNLAVDTDACTIPAHSIFAFTVGDWYALRVANALYENATVYLDRKFEKYKEMKDDLLSRPISYHQLKHWRSSK